ncbi:hypothetical protein H206_03763 [Candidatus Electrothrix aarhusensis]|uniref:Uncharacterized protein n=1 Tax=Candidatus Electrothrix aarhusensis TaxID=1859131 RepID=A0A444J1D3_9BACT|nr:hypothetical protein H206_03763 [Candidatus Electrothrix aarhusensis]
MDKAILIDTNVYKKISKNTNGIHDVILSQLQDIPDNCYLASTLFGFCEYIGYKIPKVNIPKKLSDISPSKSDLTQYASSYQQINNTSVIDYALCVRNLAATEYSKLITKQVFNERVKVEKEYQSPTFKKGQFYEALFESYSSKRSSNIISDLIDLLSVDYQHRYPYYPKGIDQEIRVLNKTGALAEYFTEKRNVVLIRSFKSSWIDRTITREEKELSPSVRDTIDQAMKQLKNDSDRFDLELLYFFLFGHYLNNKYNPVVIYTQDQKKQVIGRSVVVWAIMKDIFNSFEKQGVELIVQLLSEYRFVDDDGNIVDRLTGREFANYLFINKIIKMK